MKLSSLNINGWTDSNKQLREALIHFAEPDVLCLQETHLDSGKTIDIPGYYWIGHNRNKRHVKAKKASGGIGVLVKDTTLHQFQICGIDKSFDSILVITLKHKVTDFQLTLICVYLPPENSTWGRNSDIFFNHLTSVVYTSQTSDIVLIAGDFNARVGNLQDYINDIDDIPKRKTIDTVKNSHGESLIEFLKDTQMIIVNGRISENCDNFTCINSRGKSVVDFIMLPHDCIKFCSSFKVDTIANLLSSGQLYNLISGRCKSPDHSLISITLTCSYLGSPIHVSEPENNMSTHNTQETASENTFLKNSKRISQVRKSDNTYTNSNTWKDSIMAHINRLETVIKSQTEIDDSCNSFCEIIFAEIDSNLQINYSSKFSRKRYKHFKPYWSNELTKMWKEMRDSENNFLTTNKHTPKNLKNELRHLYKSKRHTFDKQKGSSRRYRRCKY